MGNSRCKPVTTLRTHCLPRQQENWNDRTLDIQQCVQYLVWLEKEYGSLLRFRVLQDGTNRCRALFEFFHISEIEYLLNLFFYLEYRWEHSTTTHKEVNEPAIIVIKSWIVQEKNAPRQSCAIKGST